VQKAFLSHSSLDKTLVRQVADELGRESAIYDDKSFDGGYDLKDAIRDGLDRSSVFVLFASENSVGPGRSDWLKFEDEEGNARSLSGIVRRPMAFIIDDKVSVADLPSWLTAARVTVHVQDKPKLIALKIQQHLADLIREDQAIPVLGRGLDADRAVRLIRPREGSVARAVAFYGLKGIGRRTLCRDVFRDLFSAKELQEIRVEEGDDLGDLTLKLADLVGQVSTKEQLRTLATTIRSETTEQQLRRCTEYLKALVDNNFVPTLVDQGGVLDAEGHLIAAVDQLRRLATKENDILLALIVPRRIVGETGLKAQAIPSIRVDPLGLEDTERLIALLGEKEGFDFDTHTLHSLASWVKGHPPSAAHAVELVARDGLSQVIDGTQIVAYRESFFLRSLERDGYLTKHRRTILRVLAEYGHLPEDSLLALVGLNKIDYDKEVRYLLDKAFVIPERQGLYRLADPLTEAVQRIIADFKINHSAIAQGLEAFIKRLDEIVALDENDRDLRRGRLDAERLLWRARTAAGDAVSAEKNVYLAADVISALRTSFHAREYDAAISIGQVAVEMRPDSVEARSLLARAYINKEKYTEAHAQIDSLKDRGHFREQYFLLGYLYHQQGDHQNAVYAFKESIRYGRSDAGIFQRLAESYYFLEEYSDAEYFVRKSLESRPENRYSLDLRVRILIRKGEFEKARKALAQLMIYDDSAYYLHRKSVLELAEGNVKEALADATQADRARSNIVAIQVQLALCQIASNRLSEARTTIAILKRRLQGTVPPDVLIGLEVKVLIVRGKFEEGLVLLGSLANKKNRAALAMRLECLKGYIGTLKLGTPLRGAMIEERDKVLAELGDQSMASIWASAAVF
jgi:tetratricopeptide (TPR) repeat protein